MKNGVVNFAAEQIKSNEINKKILESTFFKEYYKVFRNNIEFYDDIITNLNSHIDINELTLKVEDFKVYINNYFETSIM